MRDENFLLRLGDVTFSFFIIFSLFKTILNLNMFWLYSFCLSRHSRSFPFPYPHNFKSLKINLTKIQYNNLQSRKQSKTSPQSPQMIKNQQQNPHQTVTKYKYTKKLWNAYVGQLLLNIRTILKWLKYSVSLIRRKLTFPFPEGISNNTVVNLYHRG